MAAGGPARISFNPATFYADAYGLLLALAVNEAITSKRFTYDASIRMPTEVREAFGSGMRDITREGPNAIDRVLADIDAARDTSAD